MKTKHSIIFDTITKGGYKVPEIDLVMTSPPYPMVKMWDKLFETNDYKKMVSIISEVIVTCNNYVKKGGIFCVNIGDAVRNNGTFQLYNNHVHIVQLFSKLGYTQLPSVIWVKPSNSPTKFMGSGTLPVKAYVTLEHEYILIFRKGERKFLKGEEKRRRRSAFFWEERNKWFSDKWEIRGVPQTKNEIRTAAYDIDIPYRIINMYSIQEDFVLDPFLGTGTTVSAAMASGRNSIGFEINKRLHSIITATLKESLAIGKSMSINRLSFHESFITPKNTKYTHKRYGKVVTAQETGMMLPILESIDDISIHTGNRINFSCQHKFL